MAPERLALLDRLRAEAAAEDITDRLAALLAEDCVPCRERMPVNRPETWNAEARAVWDRLVWLWQASVTGRDPDDHSPITPDELVLLRLALL